MFKFFAGAGAAGALSTVEGCISASAAPSGASGFVSTGCQGWMGLRRAGLPWTSHVRINDYRASGSRVWGPVGTLACSPLSESLVCFLDQVDLQAPSTGPVQARFTGKSTASQTRSVVMGVTGCDTVTGP